MPRGNSAPWPDVTRTSPTSIPVPPRARYLNRSVPGGAPSTMRGRPVPPIVVGVPDAEGCAVRPGDASLDRRGHQPEEVPGAGAVAAGLEREEQQADTHDRDEQRELPNLHPCPPTTERGDAP